MIGSFGQGVYLQALDLSICGSYIHIKEYFNWYRCLFIRLAGHIASSIFNIACGGSKPRVYVCILQRIESGCCYKVSISIIVHTGKKVSQGLQVPACGISI